ncbi:MAG TPA: penicillin acylase family protein [Streptosporangiaceae bacterium]
MTLATALALPFVPGPALAAGDHVRIGGLDKPVTIDIDHWGVPHIFARTTGDAFLAQGFNAARDRLFQIDLWRRRGLGHLSSAFGKSYVAQDRAARLFLYRGDMNKEWASYGPDAKMIATRFTSGVNAYIDYLKRHPDQLPPEFRKLDYQPEKWKPEDVVRIRTHALVSGLAEELARAKLACAKRMDLDPLRIKLQPAHTAKVPAGLDPCLPKDVANVYDLATEPVSFTGDAKKPLAFTRSPVFTGEGSNNWTISPKRSATGRPILANDPHRTQQTPSLRYIAQLSAPGMDVIGAGEPALPGISIGHNDSIAFGLTVFGIDAQDLYVYDLNADNTAYRYKGGWEKFQNATTDVPVRGQATSRQTLTYTRHGPVIYVDAAKHKAYAVRSTWSLPGTSAYFASIGYMRATNWSGFRDALTHWGAPGENQVYADTKGNIGWQPSGFAPMRSGYDGLLPVPGDGRYDWKGVQNASTLPHVLNPKQGFFATANQYNLPKGWPADKVTSYEWSDPSRHDRIDESVSAPGRRTLGDSERLQNDVVDVRARAVAAHLKGLSSADPDTAAALRLMRGWNGAEPLGSVPATVYLSYWQTRLNTAVKTALAPDDGGLLSQMDWLVLLDVLNNPDHWLGSGGAAERDALLLSTLRDAYRAARTDLGADTAKWGFTGSQRTMPHPMGTLDPSLNVGPYAIPGSATSPIATGNASYRQVIDVGKWDDSKTINNPGQSGDPASPHYKDLAGMWSTGTYFPMLYSRAAVERNTERRIVLTP